MTSRDEKRNIPLHYAARYSHTEVVARTLEELRNSGQLDMVDKPGADDMTPLHFAAR